jgi:hypothetical protein
MGISSALGSQALLPAGLGFRNLLINGEFRINQRGYTSASNLASGSYGFDRWKSNFTNTTLTFTSAPQGQIVTINSGGSIEQVIERENVSAGTYVLSWTGTATGRVYNTGATPPSYAASPIVVTLDGLANVEVEFTASGGTRTLWKPQLEQNFQPTPFEQRPIGVELALCQRYYEKSFDYSTAPQNGIYSNSYISNVPYLDYWVLAMQWIEFKVEKRRVPDMSFFGDGGKWQANNSNNTWTTFAQAPTSAVQGVTGLRTSGFGFGIHNNGANGLNVVGYSRMVRGDWVASAEL